MKNRSCPENADELQACAEMRAFARLVLPVYEMEYQRQLTNGSPCWMFLSMLERRMRQLEKEAK